MAEKKILVKATNYLKIVKIPFYEDSGAVVDNPPNFPDTEFVTYKGKKDKIKPEFILKNTYSGLNAKLRLTKIRNS